MKHLVVTFVTLSSLSALSGCASQTASPGDVAKEFSTAFHQDNLTKAAQYTAGSKVLDFHIWTPEGKVMSKAMFGKDKFTVESYSITSKNKAAVKLKMSLVNVPLTSLLLDPKNLKEGVKIAEGQLSKSQLEKIQKAIEKSPMYTKEVTLNMVKVNGQWKVANDNNAFDNAIMGADAPLPPAELAALKKDGKSKKDTSSQAK